MFSIRSLFSALVVATLAVGVLAEDTPIMTAAPIKAAIATHSQLNDATALINKNMAANDNSIAITRSDIVARQDDDVAIEADEMPPGLTLVGQDEPLAPPQEGAMESSYGYRHRFYYPHFRGGYHGWRYPVPYWHRYGRRRYGSYCPFGRTYGGYYYC